MQAGRLSDKAVALVVKRAAEAAGLDPAQYAGHSLRAGLATAAAAAGVSERVIMKQTGHKSLKMVRRYIRDGSLFRRMRPLRWASDHNVNRARAQGDSPYRPGPVGWVRHVDGS